MLARENGVFIVKIRSPRSIPLSLHTYPAPTLHPLMLPILLTVCFPSFLRCFLRYPVDIRCVIHRASCITPGLCYDRTAYVSLVSSVRDGPAPCSRLRCFVFFCPSASPLSASLVTCFSLFSRYYLATTFVYCVLCILVVAFIGVSVLMQPRKQSNTSLACT